ncbi:MAG TPA: cation diffusion facilitator family transporter [Bacillota bacterium]|nr:cation diffusion facilitator family transporter [Bacillota bacterium]
MLTKVEEANQAKSRAAGFSVLSNTILVAGKLAAGIMMGSVSVISEGIHSSLDLVAALIAFFSIKQSNKPADDQHPYGHGKIENVSGTIEALLIFVAAIYIIYEAVQKLLGGGGVESVGLGAAIMAVSAVANFFLSRYLLRIAKATDSVALEADGMHLLTDVYTSVGVLAGLGAIKLTGWHILDPLAAIGVALLIIKAAWDLTKTAFVPIIDTRLPAEEEQVILAVLERHSAQFVEFHKLRSRKSGAERFVDLHLVVPKHCPVHEVHAFCHHLEARISEALPNSHLLIHVEPCNPGDTRCQVCKEGCK